jgi:hypothetical protein
MERHQRWGTIGENQRWWNDIVVNWEELFRKIAELLQHRRDNSRTEYRHWRSSSQKLSNVRTDKMMVNVQQHINCNNLPSSQTFRSYVQREFHKSNIHGRTTISKYLINETNAQMRQRWCHDHKTGHQTTGKALVISPDESSCFRWTQGSLQSGMPGSNSETRGRFCDCWAAISR